MERDRKMSRAARGYVELALLAAIIVLTLSTAYVHYWVGGIMLMLNAAGYLGLTVLVVGSAVVFRRALPLVLVALAAYAAMTIVAYLVMGPHIFQGWLAKAIEVALIAAIGVQLWRTRDELRSTIDWGRSLLATTYGRMTGRRSGAEATQSPAAAGEE
jgi:hypothetical protein